MFLNCTAMPNLLFAPHHITVTTVDEVLYCFNVLHTYKGRLGRLKFVQLSSIDNKKKK